MIFRFRLFIYFAAVAALSAQTAPVPPPASDQTIVMNPVTTSATLDRARAQIAPQLGATSFSIDQQQIENQPQGDDAPFNQVLLRAPGVAEDSAANGGIHVRGEHANLQYRINDVLLPEGISGFGLELDPRFVNKLQLITGSLPAQYGFRTAGVVDIQTRTGTGASGGQISLYGGSFDTVRPSVEVYGSSGTISYFADASYDHNQLGIENPTSSAHAIHDTTDQSKAFAYLSYLLDATSRLSFIGSASYSTFEVPNTPGLPPGTAPNGQQWVAGSFNSAGLNENQNEQNDYGVVAYQKSAGDLNYQVSGFVRSSTVHFLPDPLGDLYFNGVASDVRREIDSEGVQTDASYAVGLNHTLRGGFSYLNESSTAHSLTTVFPVDDAGDPTGPAFTIADNHRLSGLFAGAYLQDEWRLTPQLTINAGARADVFKSSFDNERQLSPRINLVATPSATTTLHAGYSRYFTPPPVEDVPGSTIERFAGTSNAPAVTQDDPVRAERADYFDVGGSQQVGPGFQVGIDGYYKQARNQLDDGLFGQTLILSAFNYAEGRVSGAEVTASYVHGGFSTYLNFARSQAMGKRWSSAQFLFDPADLAYVQSHWIHLDHDQTISASSGAAYLWKQAQGSTRLYVDALFGDGLRNDAVAADGTTIPNGGSVPSYVTFNLGGEQTFRRNAHHAWRVRIDVLNLADRSYELRNGSGVGVNAAQFGQRFGLFGSTGYLF